MTWLMPVYLVLVSIVIYLVATKSKHHDETEESVVITQPPLAPTIESTTPLANTPQSLSQPQGEKSMGIKTQTKKGEIVRSKAEARIANYLFDNNIEYEYEKSVVVDGRNIHPDFYLPKYNLFIEFYGLYGVKARYTTDVNLKEGHYIHDGTRVLRLLPFDYNVLEKRVRDAITILDACRSLSPT